MPFITDPDAPGDDLDDLDDLEGQLGGDPDSDELLAAAADDRARVQALERRLVALERAQHVAPAAEADAEVKVVRVPKYGALAEFVEEEFCLRYTRRRHGGRWRWCPQWWEHSEAVSRLDALHKAWEAMHDDGPNGMGDWYRNHLDHQLPILLGADGPFRRCGNQHYPPDPDDDLSCGTPPADTMAWRNE